MNKSWEYRVDPRGRPYYVDHNTRTTTWHRPVGKGKEMGKEMGMGKEVAKILEKLC